MYLIKKIIPLVLRDSLRVPVFKLYYFFQNIVFRYRGLLFSFYQTFLETKTIKTKYGIFTVFLADKAISKKLYVKRQFELPVITKGMEIVRNIHPIAKGEGVVLDIGANNGVIAIEMIKSGEVRRAIAIEPEPKNFHLLKKNVAQNDLTDDVICINAALADKESIVSFELSDDNYGDHRVRNDQILNTDEIYNESERDTISVKARKLDVLLDEIPDEYVNNLALVWIDVQGYEGYVFQGGRKTFKKDFPVMTEIWPYGIERSGFDKSDFCNLVKDVWKYFWILEEGQFIRKNINEFGEYFKQLEGTTKYSNIILTHN